MKQLLWILPLLFLPALLSDFWLMQVITRSIILGITALSLTFLATYLGVVSFAQITMAGVAAYTIAYFGPNSVSLGIELPVFIHVSMALVFAIFTGALIGVVAHRSRGIYAIMITLAIAVAFFYFTRQNYAIFNGWTGFSGVSAPKLFGTSLRNPILIYYVSLITALLMLVIVYGFVRSPMGLTIQAVRDAPNRVKALGIPTYIPIITAFSFSGFIAGSGGILNVWFQERVSSFSVGIGPIIDILIISVIGGIRYPTGVFIGAIVFVLLDTFAVDFIDRERFNTLIGLVLLIIIMVAPNGLYQVFSDIFSYVKNSIKKKH